MMNRGNETIVGLFRDRDSAQCAVENLRGLGLGDDQIGFAMRDQENIATNQSDDKTGSNAAGGAVAGGVLGAILGAAAALLIPGIGPVIAGGILAAALGGAAVGAIAGGLIGALTSMGVPEEEARYYDQEFQAGNIVVSAQAGSYASEAIQVMRDCGAYNLTGEATEMQGSDAAYASDSGAVQLREEQLRARKEPVQAGEVVVRKETVTETQNMQVPVTREEVVVERRRVDGGGTTQDIPSDQEIRVPVMEEEVIVEKRPVVREEVRVRKETVQDTEEVSAEVRHEEARIERSGNVNVRDTNS